MANPANLELLVLIKTPASREFKCCCQVSHKFIFLVFSYILDLFRDVECFDTVEGAQCGTCPSGYSGDGRNCELLNACLSNPCPTGIYKIYMNHSNK